MSKIEFKEKFDIGLDQATTPLGGVSERYPSIQLSLNRIGQSYAAKRIEKELGWSPARQVVRTQFTTSYFLENLPLKYHEIMLDCLSTAFTVEDRANDRYIYEGQRYVSTDERSRMIINKAAGFVFKALEKIDNFKQEGEKIGDKRVIEDKDLKLIEDAITAAKMAVTGLYLGGKMSGKKLHRAFLNAVGDLAGASEHQMDSFLDYEQLNIVDQALRMSHRGVGIDTSVSGDGAV